MRTQSVNGPIKLESGVPITTTNEPIRAQSTSYPVKLESGVPITTTN